MNVENLNIILFAIPVYQLLYFTIQVIIARKYSPQRIFFGIFLVTICTMAVLNIYTFYQGHKQGLLEAIFLLVFAGSTSTFYLYLRSITLDVSKFKPNILLKNYSGLLVYFAIAVILFVSIPLFSPNGSPPFINDNYEHAGANALSYILILLALFYFLLEQFRIIPLLSNIILRNPGKQNNAIINDRNPYIGYQTMISAFGLILIMLLPVFYFSDFRSLQATLVAYNILLFLIGGRMGYLATKIFENSKNPADLLLFKPAKFAENNNNHTSAFQNNNPGYDSYLSIEEAELLLSSLQKIMKEDKPFTNPRFSLDELCLLLNTNKRKARYLINHVLNNNFYGLINEYRVEESIRILETEESKKYTIDSIALMSGFQSKSTFYAAFKKCKNVTPGEYKEIKAS